MEDGVKVYDSPEEMYEPKDIYSWDYWDHAMRNLRSAEKQYISKDSDVNDKETD